MVTKWIDPFLNGLEQSLPNLKISLIIFLDHPVQVLNRKVIRKFLSKFRLSLILSHWFICLRLVWSQRILTGFHELFLPWHFPILPLRIYMLKITSTHFKMHVPLTFVWSSVVFFLEVQTLWNFFPTSSWISKLNQERLFIKLKNTALSYFLFYHLT